MLRSEAGPGFREEGGAHKKARALGVVPKARARLSHFSCSGYLMVFMVFCTILTTFSGSGA